MRFLVGGFGTIHKTRGAHLRGESIPKLRINNENAIRKWV